MQRDSAATVELVSAAMLPGINSHNEWDPLREAILGTADGMSAILTWSRPDAIPADVFEKATTLAREAFPDWLIAEVNEDLEGIAAVLRSAGVVIHRPCVHDLGRVFASPFGWSSTGNNLYNVRDLHLVIGDFVIESASPLKCRAYEPEALYHVWYHYFDRGMRWISAPQPTLRANPFSPYFRDAVGRELTDEDKRYLELTGGRVEKLHKLSEDEILFEAANTVRMGRDILYLVSSSGNCKGAKWLQSVLGSEYRVHTTSDIYRSSHIDSTVLCLRPGLVLLNSVRVNESNRPSMFDTWDRIYFDDVAAVPDSELEFQKNVRDRIHAELTAMGFESNIAHIASPWVGMNVLSLDPETVLVDSRQGSLIKVLEQHGFTAVPVRVRHPNIMGGGLHCSTLDTVRDSRPERYF